MTREESQELRTKAKNACMTEARLIRMLVAGYQPPAAPDDRFYQAMDLVKNMGDEVRRAADQCCDSETAEKLLEESKKWHVFQAEMEKHYLLPKRSDGPWQ